METCKPRVRKNKGHYSANYELFATAHMEYTKRIRGNRVPTVMA